MINMEYKLEQWYPGLLEEWKVGDIFNKIGDKYYNSTRRSSILKGVPKEQVENNPEYWTMFTQNSYEVLELKNGKDIYKLNLKGNFIKTNIPYAEEYPGLPLKRSLETSPEMRINKIGKVCGTETFKVGDLVTILHNDNYWFNITSFDITNEGDLVAIITDGNHHFFTGITVDNLELVKRASFVGHDGLPVYEGDDSYAVDIYGEISQGAWQDTLEEMKYFSTREAAERYVIDSIYTFKTEDGVPFYKGMEVYGVESNKLTPYKSTSFSMNDMPKWKLFADKENAEEYIMYNAKRLSLNEVLEWNNDIYLDTEDLEDMVIDNFTEIKW